MSQDKLPPARTRRRTPMGTETESVASAMQALPAVVPEHRTWVFPNHMCDEVIDYAVEPVGPFGGPLDDVEAILVGIYQFGEPGNFHEAVAVQKYAEQLAEARWLARLRATGIRIAARDRIVNAITPTFGGLDPVAARDRAWRLVTRWTRGHPEAEEEVSRRCAEAGDDLGFLLGEAYLDSEDAFKRVNPVVEAADRSASRLLDHHMKLRALRKKEELQEIKHNKAVTEAIAADERRRQDRTVFQRRFPSDE